MSDLAEDIQFTVVSNPKNRSSLLYSCSPDFIYNNLKSPFHLDFVNTYFGWKETNYRLSEMRS